jgi:hypothetical protein
MADNGSRRYPEPNDLDVFRAWLNRHEAKFRTLGRPTSDIAYQAIQDGCSLIIVRQWETRQRFKDAGNLR